MKHYIFLTMLFCSAFLVGCTASSNNTPPPPLYIGTEGIALSFPNQNNLQQYANDTFSIALRLENKGATDVGASTNYTINSVSYKGADGYLSVTYDPATISPQSNIQQNFSLLGRSLLYNIGQVDFYAFTFKANPLSGNRGTLQTPITFTACYPYTTTFLKTVCVDRDFYNTQLTKLCVGTDITDSSQGAPISIVNVEPRFVQTDTVVQPRYLVTLQNNGQGYTLANMPGDDSKNSCIQSNLNRNDFGKIYVTGLLGAAKLNCGTDDTGITRFDQNTVQIICKLDNSSINPGPNYESTLTIQAHYIYIDSLTADVTINKDIGGAN